jgi:hypothetical protein
MSVSSFLSIPRNAASRLINRSHFAVCNSCASSRRQPLLSTTSVLLVHRRQRWERAIPECPRSRLQERRPSSPVILDTIRVHLFWKYEKAVAEQSISAFRFGWLRFSRLMRGIREELMKITVSIMALASFLLVECSGPQGPQDQAGPPGEKGAKGDQGPPAPAGSAGSAGLRIVSREKTSAAMKMRCWSQ